MEKEELLACLGEMDRGESGAKSGGAEQPSPSAEPISGDPEAFWKGGELPDDLLGEVRLPPLEAALIKRLGNFPFWRGSRLLSEYLEPVYFNAARYGMDVFLREAESGKPREKK
jgi:uncharacterized Zn finger protein